MPENTKIIKFSEWKLKWGEGRKKPRPEENDSVDKRHNISEFDISPENLKSHEENIKWESEMAFHCLDEVRKRKFFAINAAIIIFPGLISGFIAAATYLEKVGFGENNVYGYYWVSAVVISMFIGMANMISIKYIAAFKAQANLLIRQLNCLRQAMDSITYYKFEGKYPIHLWSLTEGGVYYKVFGKHRKLPIGNDSFRNRLIGSYTESADKSLIGFLFISSLTLISAPFIYLIALSSNHWNDLSSQHIFFMGEKTTAIASTMLMVLLSIIIFIYGHWGNFKNLRTADGTSKLPDEKSKVPDILFKFVLLDYVSMMLLMALACYWFYLAWNSSDAIYNVILLVLSVLSIGLSIMCVSKVFFDSLNRIHRSLTYKASFNTKTKNP